MNYVSESHKVRCENRDRRIRNNQIKNRVYMFLLVALMAFVTLWFINTFIHIIEVKGCLRSTPAEFTRLHCEEVIK